MFAKGCIPLVSLYCVVHHASHSLLLSTLGDVQQGLGDVVDAVATRRLVDLYGVGHVTSGVIVYRDSLSKQLVGEVGRRDTVPAR